MSRRTRDAIVVGGGPAGLALAAGAARAGLDVLLLERRALPADKACGEGLLPRAVEALRALGATAAVGQDSQARFGAIRWIDDGGAVAEARLPAPGGLGVRRLALSRALLDLARRAGAEVRERAEVRTHRRGPDRVVVETAAGEEQARVLVAADGLASPVRRREGLDAPAPGPARFGLRRHFAVAPWADAVEVHFTRGAEGYVTPVGPERVGVAFLFEGGAPPGGFDALVSRFPRLRERLGGAPPGSGALGSGPLRRRARALAADRVVLLGDAAGYLDAITGEGLSLSLEAAADLSRLLPEALARGAGREAFLGYQRAVRARQRRYAAVAGLVLAMARRPRLRRTVIGGLSRSPALFASLVRRAVG
ncbi:MAG TPA: FAD-dependent monooxygenase [Anaeromyxobacteraceae bacterium]|nr:FAD-dependent monooxygenase [Anaeromyxobacteraceae bacterium]